MSATIEPVHVIQLFKASQMDRRLLWGWNVSHENATVTETPEPAAASDPLAFRAPMHLLYVVLLVLSTAGNSMVIFISLRLRSTFMILILNLAVCDLLTPLLSVPFDIAQTESGERWLFGVALCKLLWPLQTLFCTSSSSTLVVICYDRYHALTRPFDGPTRLRTALLWIAVIHLASFILVAPYVAVLNFNGQYCEEHWPQPVNAYRKSYTMLLFLVQYAMPLIIMSVLYPVALRKLRASSDNVFTEIRQTLPGKGDADGSHTRAILLHRRKQHLRVTKMFILVVVVFAIGMFPNQVYWMWYDYGSRDGHSSVNLVHVQVICRLFTYSNSVLNPVIYCFRSREFRAGFRRIGATLCGSSRRQHTHADYYLSSPTLPNADSSRKANGAALDTSRHGLLHQQENCSLIDNATKAKLPDFVSAFNGDKQALLEHFNNLKESDV